MPVQCPANHTDGCKGDEVLCGAHGGRLFQSPAEKSAGKSAALEREETMRARVEALASDPISANVRKYGVTRTKLLQEQVEQMHTRSVELTQRLERESQTVAALRSEVKQAQGDLTAASQREELVRAARDTLASERAVIEKQKKAAERALTDHTQQLQ